MAGPFSGPDSSHRPIRHAGPSGHSRSPRPAVHPPTFGTRSGRLSIRPHPETLPAICPSCLAEPLPAVRPSGPSKTIFARSPPHLPEPRPPKNARFATHPVTPQPHLSARSSDSHAPGRSDRHTSDPPVSAPPKATKKAIPESHWIPGSPDRQRSTESILCNRIISTTGSGRTPLPNGSAASRSDRPKGSRRGSSTFRRSTRHWSS